LNVGTNGEIISTIASLRDESLFACSRGEHRCQRDDRPTHSARFGGNETTPSIAFAMARRSLPTRENIQSAISLTAIGLIVRFVHRRGEQRGVSHRKDNKHEK
jgi:hypothetical protein